MSRRFGEQIPVGQVHSCIFDWIHSENEPLATFIFRYRSLRALKSIGIVPRTPSPEPLEERDAESLTVDEARELIRRYKVKSYIECRITSNGLTIPRHRNRPLPVEK